MRVSPEEARRIAAHLGLRETAFRSRYLAASGESLAEGPGGRCVFLLDGRRTACAIYPVRPERCRSWPFWPELGSPTELAAAIRLCPGIEPREPA